MICRLLSYLLPPIIDTRITTALADDDDRQMEQDAP